MDKTDRVFLGVVTLIIIMGSLAGVYLFYPRLYIGGRAYPPPVLGENGASTSVPTVGVFENTNTATVIYTQITIKNGSGRIYFHSLNYWITTDLVLLDSLYTARDVAAEYTQIDVKKYDFAITFINPPTASGLYIHGSSCGGAYLMGFLSLLTDTPIDNENYVITATAERNGLLGPVGMIESKYAAVLVEGKSLIVSSLQDFAAENVVKISTVGDLFDFMKKPS